MKRGKLVPDDLLIEMVNSRLATEDCLTGFILDGYPRTIAQAKALHVLFTTQKLQLDGVVYITVPDQVIVARLSGRRICPACGAIYHREFNPSAKGDDCEQCYTSLIQRPDDQAEAIQKRIEVYKQSTIPVLNYYQKEDR